MLNRKRSQAAQPVIEVQIDALRLDRLDAFDIETFSTALNGELTRLISDGPPALPGPWHVDSVQISAPAGVDSTSVGVGVAQAIYQQIAQRG